MCFSCTGCCDFPILPSVSLTRPPNQPVCAWPARSRLDQLKVETRTCCQKGDLECGGESYAHCLKVCGVTVQLFMDSLHSSFFYWLSQLHSIIYSMNTFISLFIIFNFFLLSEFRWNNCPLRKKKNDLGLCDLCTKSTLSSTSGERVTQVIAVGLPPWGHLNNIRSDRADCTRDAALFPLSPPPEQPAASGQQPPNCWGEGVLPYLIALDDVIDLPQVVAATCFVADLQQHQAYFLLSQFSCSDSTLLPLLKHTERGTEMGEKAAI